MKVYLCADSSFFSVLVCFALMTATEECMCTLKRHKEVFNERHQKLSLFKRQIKPLCLYAWVRYCKRTACHSVCLSKLRFISAGRNVTLKYYHGGTQEEISFLLSSHAAPCPKLFNWNPAGLYRASGSSLFVYGNLICVCAQLIPLSLQYFVCQESCLEFPNFPHAFLKDVSSTVLHRPLFCIYSFLFEGYFLVFPLF